MAVLLVALALLLRAARGYDGALSQEDLALLPPAWDGFAPRSLWWVLVATAERTIGLAWGSWLSTLLLSIATTVAGWRLLRAVGADGFALPGLAALVMCGNVEGVGIGLEQGVFADGFHAQWLALCSLLFAYDAFLRGRAPLAGVLLGLACATQPWVGLQGLACVAFASLVAAEEGRGWRLAITLGLALLLGAPVLLPLAQDLLAAPAPWEELVATGYAFRPIYAVDEVGAPLAWALVLFVVLGLAGGALLARTVPAARSALGLLLAHVLLLLLALGGSFVQRVLELTRTTPALLLIAGVLAVASLEHRLSHGRPEGRADPLSAAVGLGVALLLATVVRWHALLLVALALFALAARARSRGWDPRPLGAALALTSLAALGWCVRSDVRDPSPALATPEAELYAWIGSTPPDASFVIPPGMSQFRTRARRAVWVEFNHFPAQAPARIPTWRRRLEQVASPDREARALRGWPAAEAWDRCYAARNTPRRIADLLHETQAAFLVWDRRPLLSPPFAAAPRLPDPRLQRAFGNQRFVVWRLRSSR